MKFLPAGNQQECWMMYSARKFTQYEQIVCYMLTRPNLSI